MNNSQRILVQIIDEICAENEIYCERFSYDWILRLTKGDRIVHVFGYQFENNSATAQLLCTDKSASSELLRSRKIPAVEHNFFMSPDDFQYTGVDGNWQGMLALLRQHGRLVCKPNEGTGGKDVFQVTSPAQLETAVTKIFAHYPSVALSPYYEINYEYRVILLNKEVKLIYAKSIPALVGDGSSTIRQLFSRYLESHPGLMVECGIEEQAMPTIPAAGTRIPINWKHNLGQGASAEIVEDQALIELLGGLAKQAAEVVNVNFASVDIIKTDGRYLVLEINSGVMMENFARQNDHNYRLTKEIYRQAIMTLFA